MANSKSIELHLFYTTPDQLWRRCTDQLKGGVSVVKPGLCLIFWDDDRHPVMDLSYQTDWLPGQDDKFTSVPCLPVDTCQINEGRIAALKDKKLFLGCPFIKALGGNQAAPV